MILKLLLVALLWGTTAYAGVPNTVGWHALSNTDIDTHGCQWTSGGNGGSSGCAAITAAWNGALFDSSRNQLVLLGNGGHADYYGNEVIALSIGTTSAVTDTQTLSRIKNSSANPQSYSGTCTLSDGSPRSMHTYTNVEYLPDQDRYISLGGARSPEGNMVNCVYYLQMPGMTWNFLANSPIDRNGGFWGSGAAYDGEQHLLWAADQFSVFHFNPATNVWTTPTQTAFSGTGNQGEMIGVVDPVRDRYYLIGDSTIWYWSIRTPSSIGARQAPTTSGCSGAFSGAVGAAYDPVQDRIVTWHGGNTIYLYNPATHACTTTTVSGGPSEVANGTYGRFRYSKRDNLFVTCQATSANCYALRLTVQSADNDYLSRCNSPGVIKCQNFDNLADYTNGQKYHNGDGGFDGADLDTSIKVSGTGSLRFNLPAGRATSDISGSWLDTLIDSTRSSLTGFGANQVWYYQYRARVTSTMTSNLANWQSGTNTGWKTLILHNATSGTCSTIELTVTTYIWSPTGTQTWYSECGAFGAQVGDLIQQGPSGSDGYNCDFNNQVAGSGNGTGCFQWQHPLEWITFYGRVFIKDFTGTDSDWEVWLARDGATAYEQVMNMRGRYRFRQDGAVNTFNRATFTPYMTGLSSAGGADANLWIDEFIVSTEPIPVPGQLSGGGGGEPAPLLRFAPGLNLRRAENDITLVVQP